MTSERDEIVATMAKLREQCDEWERNNNHEADFKRNLQIMRWLTAYMEYVN